MIKRRHILILFLIIIFGSYLYTINVQRYFSPFSSYGDPLELEHKYFTLGRYPEGYDGVSILTLDDVSFVTLADDIYRIMDLTERYNATATYFVIPRYGGEDRSLLYNKNLVAALNESISKGNEVAQHGYTHHPTAELKGKSYEEQLSLITKGKDDLENLFGPISGFRPPAFWKNTDTYKALEKAGFLYCSSASIFNVFPYNPKEKFHPLFGDDIDIIEIPCFPEDYFWDVTPEKASTLYFELVTRFESCQKKGTPFIIFTHLPRLLSVNDVTNRREALDMLDRFLSYAYENNVWMPTLVDFLEWHTMMEDLEISSRESSNEFIVSISSEKEIIGLTFHFDLPNRIDSIYIYYNGKNVYTKENCNPKELVIIQ